MATTISAYYQDELTGWAEAIDFYLEEIITLGFRLGEVIQRNSIPGIAGRVELEQEKLNKTAALFNSLHDQIQVQEEVLITDDHLVEDATIKPETDQQQTRLREQMRESEKEYIDAKYGCQEFLSATLKK